MNPEVDEQGAGVAAKRTLTTTAKKQHILQRRLKDQISESRMLEVLERQLQGDRVSDLRRKLDSNQEEETAFNADGEEEEELVCVSTMVAVAPSAAPADYEQRVCGVLKTVRCMHRQRASENQSDHATKSTATLATATAHQAAS